MRVAARANFPEITLLAPSHSPAYTVGGRTDPSYRRSGGIARA